MTAEGSWSGFPARSISPWPAIWDVVEALASMGHRDLRFDVAAVTFMDSQGLNVLVRTYKAVRRRGGRMAVAGAGPELRRLFAIRGLELLLGSEEGDAITAAWRPAASTG